MLLCNIFNKRLDDLIDSFDKENVISHCQNRSPISPQLPATGRNKATGHSELEDGMEDANKDMSDVSFFYQGITKYN